MKWLLCIVMITLTWQPNSEGDLAGYKLYSRASTVPVFKLISTLHTQNKVSVNVDGRRNWFFYVTAYSTHRMESGPSNIVYVTRGY